eukprot:3901328-Prymnesium_polylepis.1
MAQDCTLPTRDEAQADSNAEEAQFDPQTQHPSRMGSRARVMEQCRIHACLSCSMGLTHAKARKPASFSGSSVTSLSRPHTSSASIASGSARKGPTNWTIVSPAGARAVMDTMRPLLSKYRNPPIRRKNSQEIPGASGRSRSSSGWRASIG